MNSIALMLTQNDLISTILCDQMRLMHGNQHSFRAAKQKNCLSSKKMKIRMNQWDKKNATVETQNIGNLFIGGNILHEGLTRICTFTAKHYIIHLFAYFSTPINAIVTMDRRTPITINANTLSHTHTHNSTQIVSNEEWQHMWCIVAGKNTGYSSIFQ